MRIIITRPEPDNERTAAALAAQGHAPLLAPVLRVQPVADAELGRGPWSAVAITSGNAARAIAEHKRLAELRALPIFAVGHRSAEAAREAGFGRIWSADGDVDALGRLIIAKVTDRKHPLLYLAGQDRTGDLAGVLGGAGLPVLTAVIYRTVPRRILVPVVRDAIEACACDAVLHFSRRSAATLLKLAAAVNIEDKLLALRHYCLSKQVGEPLVQAGAKQVLVATAPNEHALLALVGPA